MALLTILGTLMLALFVVVHIFSRYKPEEFLVTVIYEVVFLPKTIKKAILALRSPPETRDKKPPQKKKQSRISWDIEPQNEIEQFALSFLQLSYQTNISKLTTRNKLVDFLHTTWGYTEKKKHPKNKALLTLREIMLSPAKADDDMRGAMASQIADTAMFTLCMHKLDIFTDKEAWGLLLLNAQKAQDCFASWPDFFACLARGQLTKTGAAKDTKSTKRLAAYEKIQRELPIWPVEPVLQLQIEDVAVENHTSMAQSS